LGAWLSTMTEETNVDMVADKETPAPIEEATAVRPTYEDDREESGLLDDEYIDETARDIAYEER
ncbi:MAG: hypothetical protein MSS60_06680, partial [Clostridiales bacterium]|nr:hypothetical protein [Clostridiales bacterium]